MFLREVNSNWIVRTPAKLNVYLHVGQRRSDGFHDLETLMMPISLFDTLRLAPLLDDRGAAGAIRLTITCAASRYPSASIPCEQAVPGDERNLVVRALQTLQQATGCRIGARVDLIKRIPAGAGLGGGSSDAAAAMVAANRMWKLNLDRRELTNVAATLGSDVPFFFANSSALCRGRGEIVEPLRHRTRLPVVVITPTHRLASADVFQAFDENEPDSNPTELIGDGRIARNALALGNIPAFARCMVNGLQYAAFSLCPSISEIMDRLNELPVWGAAMTGSGSSCFAVCRSHRHAMAIARRAIAMIRQLEGGRRATAAVATTCG